MKRIFEHFQEIEDQYLSIHSQSHSNEEIKQKDEKDTRLKHVFLNEKGKRLFADGDKATLRREVEAAVLQEIQLAMLDSGSCKEVEEAEKDLKSE